MSEAISKSKVKQIEGQSKVIRKQKNNQTVLDLACKKPACIERLMCHIKSLNALNSQWHLALSM